MDDRHLILFVKSRHGCYIHMFIYLRPIYFDLTMCNVHLILYGQSLSRFYLLMTEDRHWNKAGAKILISNNETICKHNVSELECFIVTIIWRESNKEGDRTTYPKDHFKMQSFPTFMKPNHLSSFNKRIYDHIQFKIIANVH